MPPQTLPRNIMNPISKHHCHNMYPRRPKPLYSPLPPDTIRLLRVVPGTRRGEYTAQMIEVPLGVILGDDGNGKGKENEEVNGEGDVGLEMEYEVLDVEGRFGGYRKGGKGTDLRSAKSNTTDEAKKDQSQTRNMTEREEMAFFPILSLGGGEHQIEIPLRVRKAIEKLVGQRWDGMHDSSQIAGYADEEEEMDAGDDDSDTGDGADFYIWTYAVCVDVSDKSDREGQEGLLGRILGGARGVISVE
jgi:hypothetical protein